ncbi:hypothetical protein HDU99_003850, partial [Rhizoclosmatium hyalinum]
KTQNAMGNTQSNLVNKGVGKLKNKIARNNYGATLAHGPATVEELAAPSMLFEGNDPSLLSPVPGTNNVPDNKETAVASPVITPSVVHSVASAQHPEPTEPRFETKGKTCKCHTSIAVFIYTLVLVADLVDPKLSEELETESKKLVNAVLNMIQSSSPPTTFGKMHVDDLENLSKNSPLASGKELVDMIEKAANSYSENEKKLTEVLEKFTASIPAVSDITVTVNQGLKSLDNILTNVADVCLPEY